jgi:hypothetical protein
MLVEKRMRKNPETIMPIFSWKKVTILPSPRRRSRRVEERFSVWERTGRSGTKARCATCTYALRNPNSLADVLKEKGYTILGVHV